MATLNTVKKCEVWQFQVDKNNGYLVEKDGTPKKEIVDFCNKILSLGNNEWDIVYCGDLVAFKNQCERVTYIYDKYYWELKMRDSFNKLDIIHID